MFAIVEIAGVQFEVEKGMIVKVPLLKGNPGETVEFDNILLGGPEGKEKIGNPFINGGKVKAKILEHGKDPKILVFHKKRRKGYRKLNGHRQHFTKIEIIDIKFGRTTKKTEIKEEIVENIENVENN